MARIPTSVTEARIVLQEDYEESWAESPEMFREKVSRKVVEKAMAWMGLVDGGKSQQKLYRSLYDKEDPKTDFGIFLTNALPLSEYSLMGVFPVQQDQSRLSAQLLCPLGQTLGPAPALLHAGDPGWGRADHLLLRHVEQPP